MGRRIDQLLAAGRVAARSGKGLLKGGLDDALGESLAEELDQMKGLAMKVGQILSYLDGAVPERTAARLARLQEGHQPMPPQAVEAVVREALGAGPTELFEDWNPEPVASASIGQVHRARLGGWNVAVKVRYPEIARALEDDARSLGRLARLISMGTQVDGPAVVDELRQRLREECDYLAEARSQVAFRAAWSGVPWCRIPDVVLSHSAETVLTTVWEDGRSFAEFCESAGLDERNRAARAMVQFNYGSLLGHAALQADPHPGNLRFADDHVVFLDYGCIRRFTADEVSTFRELSRVVVRDDRHHFDDALIGAGLVANPNRFDFEFHYQILRQLYAPFIESSFRFERSWYKAAMDANGPTNPNALRMAFPPVWVWIARMQWGLAALLVRMGPRVDLRECFEALLDEPAIPLAA